MLTNASQGSQNRHMNLLSMIASLRKFGNFVVGLFPILGTILDWLLAPFARAARGLQQTVLPQEKLDQITKLQAVKAATPAVRRFYWKDYAQDRLVLDSLPPGSLNILRPLFLVTVALCLLIPVLNVWTQPAVSLTTLAGVTGSAPLWSIWLWLVAAALAWGCLLAGSAFCNRLFFCFVAVIYITLLGACALFIPRSYCNVLIPLAVFLALGWSECNLRKKTIFDSILSVCVSLGVGAPAGVYLLALTPMQPLFKPFVLESGLLLGGIFALSIRSFCRSIGKHSDSVRLTDNLRQSPTVAVNAAVLTSITFAFLLTLIGRGGPSNFAAQLLSEMSLWNGYLWPVWYFIGIGIVFKLIKNTKVITRAVKEALPQPLYMPVVVLIILSANLLLWRTTLVNWALPFDALAPYSVPFYQATKWFWSDRINSFSADVLKWAFLFDLVAVIWLCIKRRFNAESAGTLLYFSALSWFAVTEYMFQWLSFGRSPTHSIILLMTFSMWLLWLFHTVGLEMSLQTSRAFPSLGRLAIFGSIVVFALLDIHARSAIKDYGVMNEIFLFMFRGIIDVGLPYFLYVFASRRFKQLPLKVAEIFQIFCAGAVLTYPLNILDKLALGNWTISGLGQVWEEEIASFTNNGFIAAQEPQLGLLSIALRSAFFVVGLSVVVAIVKYQTRISERSGVKDAAVIFACLAFASGFASFSKTIVDLPLPDHWRILVAPFHTSLFFDYYLVALYLSAGIAALLFAFIIVGSKSQFKYIMAGSIAFAVNLLITWVWPRHEPWLRSTGMLQYGSVAGGIVLLYLLVRAVSLIESESQSSAEQSLKPVVTNLELTVATVALLAFVIYQGAITMAPARLVPANLHIAAISPELKVPLRFGAAQLDPSGKSALFTCKEGSICTLTISEIPANGRDVKTILLELVKQTQSSKVLSGFTVIKAQDYSRFAPGALALEFSYNLVSKRDGSITAMNGLTVLKPTRISATSSLSANSSLPATPNFIQYYCMCATPLDMDVRKYDLIRILQSSKF